jgi:hypothetical protein
LIKRYKAVIFLGLWGWYAISPPASEPQTIAPISESTGISFSQTNYHGWPGAWIISNGKVEAIIVPTVGRVMQFSLVGESGPFWENPDLFGKVPDSQAATWANFGGDKSWPAPQADWPKHISRDWPPPAAFDSMPVSVKVEKNSLVLTSSVDAHYGIRTRRQIQLEPGATKMTIVTSYEKVAGNPVKTAVWIITQLKHPAAVFLPIVKEGHFPQGYNLQSSKAPPSLWVKDGWLALHRDEKFSFKIGSDASTLIWIGDRFSVCIDAPRLRGAEYPDAGSSTEIYTNPDPAAYVELETLGPLQILKVGDQISSTNTYYISRRVEKEVQAEARRIYSSRTP